MLGYLRGRPNTRGARGLLQTLGSAIFCSGVVGELLLRLLVGHDPESVWEQGQIVCETPDVV